MEPGVRWFVHFLPSGGNVTPPYPAECRLKVFQDGWGERTVLLEGAKLSQPDGVGVLDAFPELFESPAGVYGLVIELSTKQPRTDLTASGCIMEYEREGGTTKFIPHALFSNTDSEEGTASTNSVEDVIKEGNVKPSALAPLFGDAFIQSSLVAVNASEAGLIPGLQAWNGGSELVSISEILREADRDNANRDNANQDNAARVLASLSAKELHVEYGTDTNASCCTGVIDTSHSESERAYFIVDRDVSSGQIMSIRSLGERG